MTVLTGLVRGATDSVGSITSIANIAALRALTTGRHTTDDGTNLKFWFRPNAVIYRALKTVDGSDFKRPASGA